MNELNTNLKLGTIVDLNDAGYYTFEIADGESYTFRDESRISIHAMDMKALVDIPTGKIITFNTFDRCPCCGSKNVSNNGIVAGTRIIHEATDAECEDCGQFWTSEF